MSDTTKSNQSYAGDPKKDDNQQTNPQDNQINNDFLVNIDETTETETKQEDTNLFSEDTQVSESLVPTSTDTESEDETELDIQSLKIDEEELKEAETINIDELDIDINQEISNDENKISDLWDILIQEKQTNDVKTTDTTEIADINLEETTTQEDISTPVVELWDIDVNQKLIQDNIESNPLSQDIIDIAQTSAEDMEQETQDITTQENIVNTPVETSEFTIETTETTEQIQNDLNIETTEPQNFETTQEIENSTPETINIEENTNTEEIQNANNTEQTESNEFSFNLWEQTQESIDTETKETVWQQIKTSMFQNTKENIQSQNNEQETLAQTKTQNSFSFDLSELSKEETIATAPTPAVEAKKTESEKTVEAVNIISDIQNKNELSLSEIDIKSIKTEHAKKSTPKRTKSLVFVILLIIVLGPLGYFVLAFMYPMSFPLPWDSNITADITNNQSNYVEQENLEQTEWGDEYTKQLNLLQQQAKDNIKKAKDINNKNILKYATSAYTKTSSLLEELENWEEIDIQKLDKEIEIIKKYLDMAEKDLNE